MLRREPWDLAIVGIHTAHYAGHKLWSDRNVDGEVPVAQRVEHAGALREVYRACDAAVGKLVEAAGAGTNVMVFAVHGMGPNTCRTDFLGDMLRRVLAKQSVTKRNAVDHATRTLRDLLPQSFRYAVKSRLPQSLSDGLTVFWRTGTTNWADTRAFNVFSDLTGLRSAQPRRPRGTGACDTGRRGPILDG